MAGTTYSKFFWQDWQGDPELKVCSMAAQGWWMRLLCLAGAAGEGGRVTVAGRKPTPDDMRSITGCLKVTDAEMAAWEAEIVHNKVCDVDHDGVMVSRRQRRAADKLHPQAAGGRARAKTAARTGGRFAPAEHQQASPAISPAGASSAGGENVNNSKTVSPAHQQSQPSTINHQPLIHQPSTTTPARKFIRLVEALGFDPSGGKNGHMWIGDMVRLEQEGCDMELDILAEISERRTRGRIPGDVWSLGWFEKGILRRRDGRRLAEQVAVERANTPFEDTTEKGWITRLRGWLNMGYWPPQYGPMPRTGSCKAPDGLLGQALAKWDEQGGHPEGAFPANLNGTWTPWAHLRDIRDSQDADYGDGPLPGSAVILPLRRPA